ncbi:hypothetical protein MKEN_00801100 [Mycena kentingensis (nom. inval.)]|nr:hypothetical protein MKEN_00801100 [Mycena kentingensis (nom. inval.)]
MDSPSPSGRFCSAAILHGFIVAATLFFVLTPALDFVHRGAAGRSWSSGRTTVTTGEVTSSGRKMVYLHSVPIGDEGLGSLLQHFKVSVVFAEALGAEHILSFQETHHNYSTSAFWNGQLRGGVGRDVLRVEIDSGSAGVSVICRLDTFVEREMKERAELAKALCRGEAAAWSEMKAVKEKMERKGCTGIVHGTHEELIQDMNGCIAPWVRRRVGPASTPPYTLAPLANASRPLVVGIHVRWGDTSGFHNETGRFYGSMPIHDIVRILGDLLKRYPGKSVQVKIAMENANLEVLAPAIQLCTDSESRMECGIVDSGDSVGDLYALANVDVLLVGESSYGVTAHLISPATGMTIAYGRPGGKYTGANTFGRELVFYEEYSGSVLDALW